MTSPQPSLAFKLRFQAFPGRDPPVQQPDVGKGSWNSPIVVKDGPAGLPYLSPILYVSCSMLRWAALGWAVLCCTALCYAWLCRAVWCCARLDWAWLVCIAPPSGTLCTRGTTAPRGQERACGWKHSLHEPGPSPCFSHVGRALDCEDAPAN